MYREVQDYKRQQNTAICISASGFGVIITILVIQHVSVSDLSSSGTLLLSQDQSQAFARAAIPIFGTIAFAMAIAMSGIYLLLRSWKEVSGKTTRIRKSIANVLQKYGSIFWLALSVYGIVFLFASNTIVYSTERISERFDVAIPSFYLIGCCGQPGSFPVITVYASEHIGFLLIPINLVLAPFLSILVGINGSLLVDRIKRIKQKQCVLGSGMKNKALSYAGISVGLVAGCPACAGSLLVSFMGVGSVVTGTATAAATASTSLAMYHPILIFASVASLLAAMALNARSNYSQTN